MNQQPYMNAQVDPKVTALRQLLGMDNQGNALPPQLAPDQEDQPKKRKKPSAQPNLPRKPIPQRPAGAGGW